MFLGHQPPIEGLVGLRSLVEHARLDGRGQEVVGGGDCVDVARQVQVELLHGDHLGIPSPRSTT